MRFLSTAVVCLLAVPALAQNAANSPVALNAEDAAKARKCQENLAKLDGAKEQFVLEFKKALGTTVTMNNLVDPDNSGQPGQGYLKREPECPTGGEYKLNLVGKDPECSIGASKGHALDVPIRIKGSDATTTSSK
jgi:hypothetical protein